MESSLTTPQAFSDFTGTLWTLRWIFCNAIENERFQVLVDLDTEGPW
jgi:hypothetical protein